MADNNEGFAARASDGGELCSNGTVVKTIFEGGVTLVPEDEVYDTEPGSRTQVDVTDETVEQLPTLPVTTLLSPVTVGIGSTKTRVATGAFVYRIAGVRASKGAVAAGTAFTATTHDIADPDSDPREAIYVVSVASGGGLTITKGTTAAADAAVAPATPNGELKVAEVKIQHDGSAPFDATTDDLDAAHLTVTYTPSYAFAE